ncbi:MAG: carboxylating nicotinate-nucleotide diphosphorylase [Phycisphaerales bacterium]|nr:carboxylating nicotinate-nucleotide diphosphorylase [Phycisphaerales bacterium]
MKPLVELSAELLPTPHVVESIQGWFSEDGINRGDVTTNSIVSPTDRVIASIVARDTLIVSGLEPLARGLSTPPLAGRVMLHADVAEGALATPGTCIGRLEGGRRSVLAAERTILNLLGRLSGVAVMTGRFVKAVEQWPAVICDTRKTTPGLRLWEKYAVACGGGTLHRLGLHDAALYKDNHLVGIADSELQSRLGEAIRDARATPDLSFVEVEVDTLEQFDAVLSLEPGLVDIVLLDNMPSEQMSEAVQRRDLSGSGILLEASGGLNLDTAANAAASGVDRIAVGAVTRHAMIADVGLDIQVEA